MGKKRKSEETDEEKVVPEKKAKQISPAKKWVFTLNNYTETHIVSLREKLKNDKYIFQEEVGEETGTPHLQGWVCFSKKVRPIGHIGIKQISWRGQKGSDHEAMSYACKQETKKVGGRVFHNTPLPREVEDLWNQDEEADWAKEIRAAIKEKPDHRKVWWVCSEQGGVGKSRFAKHLLMKHNAVVVGGKANDIFCGVKAHLDTVGYIDIVVIDIARKIKTAPYEAIEALKNGFFFSGKYESGGCVFNEPHVIVFCNFLPERGSMSEDRWIIREIDSVPSGGAPLPPPAVPSVEENGLDLSWVDTSPLPPHPPRGGEGWGEELIKL